MSGHVARPVELVTPDRAGLYALMVIIWGSSFFFTALALRSFGPILIVQLRTLLAAIVLGGIVVVTRRRLPGTGRLWVHFMVLGVISIALPYTLLTAAQVHVPSSMAIVLSSTTPIFVFLFATFVMRTERFRAFRLAGIAVAFAGVVLLTTGSGGGGGDVFWQAVILLTSAMYAVANIYTAKFVSSVDPITIAFLQLGFGALWLLPVTTLTDGWDFSEADVIPVIAMLELGILGSAFAYVLFFFFIKTWGSTATSMNTYLQPVVGVLLGVLVLHERPSLTGWLAMLVILAGVVLFGSANMWQVFARRSGRG